MSSQNLRNDNSINKLRNIEYVVENNLCIGCGVCEAACQNEAIKVIFDVKSATPLPTINQEKCSKCQVCLNVCYGYKVDHELNFRIFGILPTSVVGNLKRCYIGYANDQALRHSSTSGGVVTALLTYALEQGLIEGAIVTKMEAGNPPKAKAFVATTIDEICSAAGSKYCPVSIGECLRTLKDGKKYAVVGLPCQIYGVRKLAEFNTKIRNSISLYLGLLCGGIPSYFGTLYLLRSYDMEKQYITKFEFRGGGWPGRLLIRGKKQTKNEQIEICVPYPEYWRNSYQFFLPYRCTLCYDGFNEFSDISFGDAWFPHLTTKDQKGVSVIITRTEAGERLIQEAFQKGYVQINMIKAQDVTRSQQGLIRFKFLTLRARVNLCKAFRRKLPAFKLSEASPSKLDDYLSAIGLYLGHMIISKRNLWWLFDIHISLYQLLDIVRNYMIMFKMKFKVDKIH